MTIGPASRGTLAFDELVGLAAPAVQTKRLLEVQRPPETGQVALRKRFHPFATELCRIVIPSEIDRLHEHDTVRACTQDGSD
jgi:hypothetical protein